jgi:hypothetical protein
MESSAHGIDQHIGCRQMCSGLRMTGFPALEPRERIVLFLGAANLEERTGRHAPP